MPFHYVIWTVILHWNFTIIFYRRKRGLWVYHWREYGENDPMVTTDYNDTVYVGYSRVVKKQHRIVMLLTHRIMGRRNKNRWQSKHYDCWFRCWCDLMVIRGNMLANTRVYTGEVTILLLWMVWILHYVLCMRVLYLYWVWRWYCYDQTYWCNNAGQIYLGSGSDTFIQGDATAITIQHYLVYWILVVVQKIY